MSHIVAIVSSVAQQMGEFSPLPPCTTTTTTTTTKISPFPQIILDPAKNPPPPPPHSRAVPVRVSSTGDRGGFSTASFPPNCIIIIESVCLCSMNKALCMGLQNFFVHWCLAWHDKTLHALHTSSYNLIPQTKKIP